MGAMAAELEHLFLDLAKNYDWIELAEQVRWNPHFINVQPRGRWTALHFAAAAGEKSVVEWLLGEGANPLLQDVHGATPVGVAHRMEVVYLLIGAAATDRRIRMPAPTMVGGYLSTDQGGTGTGYLVFSEVQLRPDLCVQTRKSTGKFSLSYML